MRRLLTTVILVPLLFSCDSKNSAPTETDASFDESRRFENLGEGNRFKTFGTGEVEITRDPENATNVVLRVTILPGQFGGVFRDLRRVKVHQLDHQLNFHHAFVAPKTWAKATGSRRSALVRSRSLAIPRTPPTWCSG